MKTAMFRSLILILLMFGPASLVFAFPRVSNPAAAPPVNSRPAPVSTDDLEAKLKRYSKQGENADSKCSTNAGAGIDTQLGQEYKSACMASYKGAKEAADGYLSEQEAGNARLETISKLNAASCGSGQESDQKACLENSAKNYDEAAKIKAQLAQKLLDAYSKAKTWRDQNAAALKKYREDLDKIQALEAEAQKRANLLRQQGDGRSAAETVIAVQTAPTMNTSGISVAAKDGNAASLSEYKGKYPQLTQEQTDAQDYADQFASDAKDGAYRLQNQSMNYEQMAADLRLKAETLPSTKSGISGDPVPIPRDGAAARAEYQAKQAAAAAKATGTGQKGISGTSTSPGTATSEGAATPQASSTNTSQTPAGSSNYANNAAAMAPLAGTSASGGKSGVADGSSYPALNNPAAYNRGDQQAVAQGNVKPTNFGEVLGTYDPRAKTEEPQVAADEPEAKAEGTEKVAVAVGLGAGGDGGGELTGASSAPGVRGADGKPIGFSAAAGGGNLQSSRQNLDKDAAAGGGFSPDLQSGAVSIAGSEMKSAVQSLAEELGATDLDLNLGDLTEEEKAALAPLEGGDGVRNLAPIKNGRRSASVIQGSDASIQDEQSAALFSRSRSAHERALKRGNLILGTRKKL